MKVPLSWLRRFVDVDLPLDELVDVMGLNGLEVEAVHRPGAGTAGVVTKRVVAWEPHPDADTLRLVRVTDGSREIDLVCGAANFDVGDVVVHAEVGATIPPPAGSTAPLQLSARTIRGVVSNGMLCSARELELGDDHRGIMVLAPDTPVGAELTELLPVGEPVIEVAVMADRGDHHSILGIARELAAIVDTTWSVPEVPAPPSAEGVPITIAATDGCRHFVTWTIDGVADGPSPWWMRQRLAQCGVRSLGILVDVTNYVMLELGQPLHAFDLDRLHGPELTIRWAAEGERLTTLDDQDRALRSSDLVIADADRLVSLAGVMGGADTEVSGTTTRVLLEGAIWEPLTIRRSSRRLGLVSEASVRFERRVDPAGAERAVARASHLLATLAGGTVSARGVDGSPGGPGDPVVYDATRAAAFLGLPELGTDAQGDLLRRAGCDVVADGVVLTVTPPSWRGDLGRAADVAEEVARLHGYDRIPAAVPAVRQGGGLTASQRAVRDIRAAALAGGLHEVVTRPFVGETALDGVVPSDGRVTLANPLAKDAAALRPSVLESLLGVIRHNVGQGRPGTAIFEIGRIFRPAGDPLDEVLKGFGDGWRWEDPDGVALPTQPRTLALAAQGARHGDRWLEPDHAWSVLDLLAVLDEVVARVAPAGWRLERSPTERPGMHPGRTASLHLQGHEVGVVGQLHPDEADRRDLVEPVVVAELVIEPLLEHLASPVEPAQAPTLVKHPAVTVDVALVADESVPFTDLEAAVRRGGGELLDDLWWFDEYRGEQVGEGRRSVAIRLRLQAADRQLTDDDAEAVIAAVEREALAVGAALRR